MASLFRWLKRRSIVVSSLTVAFGLLLSAVSKLVINKGSLVLAPLKSTVLAQLDKLLVMVKGQAFVPSPKSKPRAISPEFVVSYFVNWKRLWLVIIRDEAAYR